MLMVYWSTAWRTSTN